MLAFRSELFRQAQRLSLSYHDTKGTGDAIYRIQSDAPQIQSLTIDGTIPFMTASCTLAGMIYVTAQINWPLALVALAISPILLLISSLYRPRLRRQWREVKKFETSALSVVQEVLAALRVVKAFGQEEREAARFMRSSSEGMRARLLAAAIERSSGLLIGLITALGTAIVLYVGLRQVRSGSMTLGELLLVMGYLAQLYEPIRTISSNIGRFQSYLASAERAFALLDEVPDVAEQPNARPLQHARGAVTPCRTMNSRTRMAMISSAVLAAAGRACQRSSAANGSARSRKRCCSRSMIRCQSQVYLRPPPASLRMNWPRSLARPVAGGLSMACSMLSTPGIRWVRAPAASMAANSPRSPTCPKRVSISNNSWRALRNGRRSVHDRPCRRT